MEDIKNSKQQKLEEIQKRIAEIQSKSSGSKSVTSKSTVASAKSTQTKDSASSVKSAPSKSTTTKVVKTVNSKNSTSTSHIKKTSTSTSSTVSDKKISTPDKNSSSSGQVTTKKTDTAVPKKTESPSTSETNIKPESKWKENNVRKSTEQVSQKKQAEIKKQVPVKQPRKKKSKAPLFAILGIVVLLAGFFYLWQFTEVLSSHEDVSASVDSSAKDDIATSGQSSWASIEGQIIISYSSNENELTAVSNVQQLKARGMQASYFWIPSLFDEGAALYKVYTGPYSTLEEAKQQLKQIQEWREDAYLLKAPIDKL